MEPRSTEIAFQEWVADPNKKDGYNYRNCTLVMILEISEDEQKHLKPSLTGLKSTAGAREELAKR